MRPAPVAVRAVAIDWILALHSQSGCLSMLYEIAAESCASPVEGTLTAARGLHSSCERGMIMESQFHFQSSD